MLDNDNIMTAKASEVVKKVPTDEKDYHKCSLRVSSIFSTKAKRKSSVAKRKSRGHFEICAGKGPTTGPWWVLYKVEGRQEFTGFSVTTS